MLSFWLTFVAGVVFGVGMTLLGLMVLVLRD